MIRSFIFAAAVALAPAAAAFAQSAAPGAVEAFARSPKSEARLLAGRAAEDGGRLAGLRITLAPGWKTYWRMPGDAGVPPRFDWSGSTNVAEIAVRWPRPHVILSYGLRTLGFKKAVTLPLEITPEDPSAPIGLRLVLDYGVCDDICTFARADIGLDIPPGAPEEGVALIEAALAAEPLSRSAAGLEVERCTIAGAGEARRFEGAFVLAEAPGEEVMAVIEGPETVWFAEPEISVSGRRMEVTSAMEAIDAEQWIGRDSLRVTLLSGDTVVDLPACGGATSAG